MLLPQHKIVKFIAVYVALGFLVMEILYFGVWCRPFHEYWAVPTDNSKLPPDSSRSPTGSPLLTAP